MPHNYSQKPKLSIVPMQKDKTDAEETHDYQTLCFSSFDDIPRFIRFDMMTWATAKWLEREAGQYFGNLLDEAFLMEKASMADTCFEKRLRHRLWSLIHERRGRTFKAWSWPLKEGVAYIKDHYHPRSPWQRVW